VKTQSHLAILTNEERITDRSALVQDNDPKYSKYEWKGFYLNKTPSIGIP